MQTKILLVDDETANLKALAATIDAADLQIHQATSGDAALALLLDHDFALALVDVQMPGMSGLELARLMRSAPRSRAVPIIFVTASRVSETDVFEGYDHGAVDYMLKPVTPHMVRSKVRVFVELDRKNRQLAEQSATLAAKLAEVQALRTAADAASQAKSRFVAHMSHEIRTPLASVLGYAELLRLPEQPADERRVCIDAIARNGQLLLRLVDDVLDLAKIEAERLEIERTKLSLAELIADIRAVHQHRAAEKGLAFEVIPRGLLPRQISADAYRLKQILNNLLGNAVKFTERGGVSLAVERDTASGRLLRFIVRDSGCGLTSDEALRLFRPFMQAEATTAHRFGGTGLGLAISKRLAQALGGDVILADSRPGHGATFVLSIDPGPIEAAGLVDAWALLGAGARESATLGGRPRIDGLRVLVADDVRDNRELITCILKAAGAQVETAEDGAVAVRKAWDGAYDVVLMDMQMPGLDGYEATSKLRAAGYARPIIALTAYAMRGELDRCLSVGCDQYFSKPVNHRELVSRLAQLAGGVVATN